MEILDHIETDRLLLRPFTPADLDALHRLWTDPEVRRYLWDDEIIPQDQTAGIIAGSQSCFESRHFGLWGIRRKQPGDDLIGFCGYWYFHDPPELQLLFGVAPDHWGKGVATEAAKAMIAYGFNTLGLDRVEASTDSPNVASWRVLEKAGMTFWKQERKQGLDARYYFIQKEPASPPSPPPDGS